MLSIRTKLLSTLKHETPLNVCKILDVAKSSICNNRTLFAKTATSSLSVKALSLSSNNSAATSILTTFFSSSRFCSSNAADKDVNKNSKILMEFFDEPSNWSETEVKSGRAWKLDELRIKSNKELHQLWFILLKERNMLFTMEHECNEKVELFPSPERLDKVKLSMSNLETVVRERNRAYHLLETGETGERPVRLVYSNLGLMYRYKSCEHVLPPFMNTKWIKSRKNGPSSRAVRKFLQYYREKQYNTKRRLRNRNRNEVIMLLRRNPNLDHALLKERYPGVNIDALIGKDKTRGHYVPKIEY